LNIIKKGELFPYKGTCKVCRSVLECTKGEVRTEIIEPCEYEEIAACPVCLERGEKTDVVFREK
jgi:hypothetical protein